MFTLVSCSEKQTEVTISGDNYQGTGSLTQGFAETKIESLLNPNPKGRQYHRKLDQTPY